MFMSSNIEQNQICNIPVNSCDIASTLLLLRVNMHQLLQLLSLANYDQLCLTLDDRCDLFHCHFLCYILLFTNSYDVDQST